MDTIKRIKGSTLVRIITLVILMVAGMTQFGLSAAQAQDYDATATLCYIDNSELTVEYKGGRILYTGAVYVWRIESDNDLINGWEYTHDNINVNKNDRGGKISGYLEMYPDEYPNGWFEEDSYAFKAKDTPEGIYTGYGTLDGVMATYATERLPFLPEEPEECMYGVSLPPLCDTGGPYDDCQIAGGGKFSVTGTITGYDD